MKRRGCKGRKGRRERKGKEVRLGNGGLKLLKYEKGRDGKGR